MMDPDVEAAQIDDPTEAIDEVVDFMTPYLKRNDQVSDLKDKLSEMGVTNFDTFTVLRETDLPSFLSIASFRLMTRKFNQRTVDKQAKDQRPEFYSFELQPLLREQFYERLKADKEILSSQDHTKLVEIVADDIRENANFVSGRPVEKIALKIVKAHPLSMGVLTNNFEDKQVAASTLATSISNHIKYIKDVLAKKKRKALGEVGNSPPKRSRLTKAAQYALVGERDRPDELPEGETANTQEAKRVSMVNMAKGGSVDIKCVKPLMSDCYVTLRWEIGGTKNLEDLLERWPFLAKRGVLQEHFEQLMDMKMSARGEEVESLLTHLEKFFERESGRKRKGAAKEITENLQRILKMTRTILRDTSDPAAAGGCHLVAMVRCAMAYMEVPAEELFICFEETTSFDDIQASTRLPDHGKPVIAVRGDNVLLNPKGYVVLDKRILCADDMSIARCIYLLVMAYFIFRVEFRSEATPILQLLHRKFLGIVSPGTRQARSKSANGYGQAPKDIHPKLGTMLKKYNTFLFELGYA